MKGTPEFLRRSRKKLGFTQQQMADELDMGLVFYQFLEYGEPLWDTKNLKKKVRDLLNVHKH